MVLSESFVPVTCPCDPAWQSVAWLSSRIEAKELMAKMGKWMQSLICQQTLGADNNIVSDCVFKLYWQNPISQKHILQHFQPSPLARVCSEPATIDCSCHFGSFQGRPHAWGFCRNSRRFAPGMRSTEATGCCLPALGSLQDDQDVSSDVKQVNNL